MNADLAIVLCLLAAAVAMFLINKPRMDAVALIMLTVLPFTGVISMGEALAGFSDSNIVLIAVLFVMGECGIGSPNVNTGCGFDREVIVPTESTELHAGDVLLVDLFRPDVSVEALRERYALEVLPLRGEYFADRSQEIGMAEVKLTATSELAVKTIVESKFRTRFGLTMIGLRH